MSADWYTGIEEFCLYWREAEMLQQTFETLKREVANDSDGSIDASKAIVECACKIIITELDDPARSIRPDKEDAPINQWVAKAIQLLKLGDTRDRAFADLLKSHNNLTEALRVLRNEAGPLSHGREGFIQAVTAHHRRAAVLSADSLIALLHKAYQGIEWNISYTREPYERFESKNKAIDAGCSIDAYGEENFLVATITLPGGEAIPLKVEISRLLFSIDRNAYIEALNSSAENPDEGNS